MAGIHDLATKADIAFLQKDIALFETSMKAAIAESQATMVKWTIGLMVALGAFLSALIFGLAGKFPVG